MQEAKTTRLASLEVVVLLALCLAVSALARAEVIPLAVPANAEWTDTGIDVLPGDRLGVVAGGQWSNVASGQTVGTNGYGSPYSGTQLADAPLAALIQRIGTSIMRISREPVPVTVRGRLYLGMNDVPGTYGDNRGQLSARIDYLRRPAPVIEFHGFRESAAREWLAAYQFTPLVESAPSNDVPAGQVFDQDPKPGVDLHGIADVRLFVSAGPSDASTAMVAVPPVVGWPVTEANAMLGKSRLKAVDGGREASASEMGIVTRTEPRAGTALTIGSPVTLWQASGENLVPDVRGSLTVRAYDILRAAGFRNMSTSPRISFGASGRVLEQSPAAGTSARLDTAIRLTESYAVPAPVIGIGGALALLVASGLVTRAVRSRKISKTRARFRLDAELDPKGTTSEPEGEALRGPAIRLRVELEAGGTSVDGAVPVVKREVRNG